MDLKNITAIVTCLNEENNIANCLACFEDMGEVILVDSFSTDGTLESARNYPAAIFTRRYDSAASQKNWAIEKARYGWILILDADEELSAELQQEIRCLDARTAADGFWIKRSSRYLGRTIKHCGWQRDKVLRLFKKGKGIYKDCEVHEEIVLNGRAEMMMNKIIHHPYRDVRHHLEKMQDYTSRGAVDYNRSGGRHALAGMILHPPFRFLRMYLLQGGFLDGLQGLVLCFLSAYGVFLKYSKARKII